MLNRHECTNCQGNPDDYYGEGYPCDQCEDGWVYPDKYKVEEQTNV